MDSRQYCLTFKKQEKFTYPLVIERQEQELRGTTFLYHQALLLPS